MNRIGVDGGESARGRARSASSAAGVRTFGNFLGMSTAGKCTRNNRPWRAPGRATGVVRLDYVPRTKSGRRRIQMGPKGCRGGCPGGEAQSGGPVAAASPRGKGTDDDELAGLRGQ